MADRISRNNQSIIQSIESETRVDLRFRFIDIRIFRCDVIIAYFFTRSAFVVKLDSIGTATVESISGLQGSSMMRIFDEGFQVRILFDCLPKVTPTSPSGRTPGKQGKLPWPWCRRKLGGWVHHGKGVECLD